MRTSILILLVGFCYGEPDSIWSQIGNLRSYGGHLRATEDLPAANHGPYTKMNEKTDPDPGAIERPCPTMDLKCIRRFFNQNSACHPAYGPAPDPFVIQRIELPIPHANVSVIWINGQVTGINDGRVLEFFVNKVTKVLVMEVEFDALAAVVPDMIIRYNRKGMEPIELRDSAAITYQSVSLTLTAPFEKEIDITNAKVYTYIGNPYMPLRVGKALYSPDHDDAYDKLVSDTSTGMREASIYQGPLYFAVFLESSVCSFRQEITISEWANQNIAF